MGQKVNPIGLRVTVNKDWRSRWFADKARAWNADCLGPQRLEVMAAIEADFDELKATIRRARSPEDVLPAAHALCLVLESRSALEPAVTLVEEARARVMRVAAKYAHRLERLLVVGF